MKVYIVIVTSYPDDHEVLGVFSSAESANRYIDNEWRVTAPDSARPVVEEYEVIV